MKITVHSSKAVKPAYGGRIGRETCWDATVVPLSVFDKVNFDDYISGIHAFHPPAPTNADLEAGLARALADYREWAGRLGVDPITGCRAILVNDAGARFVEATADVTLDSVMPLQPSPETLRLHPSGDGAEELMLVQVTRFACGSLVVGHTLHHAVGDGLAMAHCVVAWGQATRGVAIEPVPVHDRVSFFVPRDPPQVAFQHRGAEFKAPTTPSEKNVCSKDNKSDAGSHDHEVTTHIVRLSREFISELKAQASEGRMPVPFSTTQCVVAHLWRCITKARGLDGGQPTRLHLAVNGRARMSRPRVPEGYTGNVVLWAHATATARELLAGPLQHTSELIRQEVDRIDGAYFRSFIDFASSGDVEKERLVTAADTEETTLSPNVAVYCLQRIPFYDLDFGGGHQFLFMLTYQPVEGVVYILPASHLSDGSVEAQVSLFSHAMDMFKHCCYSTAPGILQ